MAILFFEMNAKSSLNGQGLPQAYFWVMYIMKSVEVTPLLILKMLICESMAFYRSLTLKTPP
jgi:hypothetical protein